MFLKQSTAATVVLGPFVDSGDAVTAETALTISQADIRLSKNGAAFAQTNNAAGATHMENGNYSVPLNTTDTNTLGHLRVSVAESGALPAWRDFMVVTANVYDSLFSTDLLDVSVVQYNGTNGTFASGRPEVNLSHIAGSAVSTTTAQLGVNVVQISGDATSADNLENYTDGTTPMPVNVTQLSGDATAADNLEAALDGTGGVTITAALTGNITGSLSGSVGSVTGAVGSVTGAVGSVSGNVGGNVTGSVGSLAAQAKADVNAEVDTALIDIHLDHLLAADYDPASKPGIGTALLNELVESDAGVSRFTANALEQAPTGGGAADGSGFTAIPWNPAWDAEVQSEVTDALNVYDPPTKAELDSAVAPLATAAALTTVDDLIDTEVAAIKTVVDAVKAKTDLLTFTVAGLLDANTKAVSDDTTAADILEALMDAGCLGQVNGVATTTSIPADGFTEATNDHFNGRLITFVTGALKWQQTAITDYVGATQTFTVSALTEAPADNDFFVIS